MYQGQSLHILKSIKYSLLQRKKKYYFFFLVGTNVTFSIRPYVKCDTKMTSCQQQEMCKKIRRELNCVISTDFSLQSSNWRSTNWNVLYIFTKKFDLLQTRKKNFKWYKRKHSLMNLRFSIYDPSQKNCNAFLLCNTLYSLFV